MAVAAELQSPSWWHGCPNNFPDILTHLPLLAGVGCCGFGYTDLDRMRFNVQLQAGNEDIHMNLFIKDPGTGGTLCRVLTTRTI